MGDPTLASAAQRSAIRPPQLDLHPLHLILFVSSLPLFLGALLSDWTYASTQHVQWLNFAAWLNAGALLFAGLALLWALISLVRSRSRHSPSNRIYVVLLASAFLTGFVNALVHAKDAWATMPEGLVLSIVTILLMLAALWLIYGGRLPGVAR